MDRLDFMEPIPDVIPIDEDRHSWDLYIKSKDDNDMKPNQGDEGLGSDIFDCIDEKLPWIFQITSFLFCFVAQVLG